MPQLQGVRGHVWKDCRKYGGGAYATEAERQQTGGSQGQYQQRTQQQQPVRPAARPGQQLATTPQNPQPINQKVPLAAPRPGGPVFTLHGEPSYPDQDSFDGLYQPLLHWGEDQQNEQHLVDDQDGVVGILRFSNTV